MVACRSLDAEEKLPPAVDVVGKGEPPKPSAMTFPFTPLVQSVMGGPQPVSLT